MLTEKQNNIQHSAQNKGNLRTAGVRALRGSTKKGLEILLTTKEKGWRANKTHAYVHLRKHLIREKLVKPTVVLLF